MANLFFIYSLTQDDLIEMKSPSSTSILAKGLFPTMIEIKIIHPNKALPIKLKYKIEYIQNSLQKQFECEINDLLVE